MQIITVANNIVTFAPEHCGGAAFWLSNDFDLQELWNDKFGPSYTQALCYPYEEYDSIWHRVPAIRPFPEQGTLHGFAPRLAKLNSFTSTRTRKPSLGWIRQIESATWFGTRWKN